MDFSLLSHESFIGKKVTDLPTPALVLSKPVLERNTQQVLEDVKALNIAFRPHVKTLKSAEVTRMMLGNGTHRRIVASTLAEIRGALELAKEGILDECLYGLPIYPGALPHLKSLSSQIKILLMIDNVQQVEQLEKFASQDSNVAPWSVFIKVDVGTRRAGLESTSPAFLNLVKKVETSPAVSLYGFYCHAGHSYGCRTTEAAEKVLGDELDGVVKAAGLLDENSNANKDRKLVVSIGSTPTAHVAKSLRERLPKGVELELHAGNYPANDLQQVNTKLVTENQQAVRVIAEVCSVYSERNEALVNAGTIALSKETSDTPGYGLVTDHPQWNVLRTSQEHGILCTPEGKEKVDDVFSVGQKVLLYIQHACITASNYHVYYVVDENDVVRETWKPWKGW